MSKTAWDRYGSPQRMISLNQKIFDMFARYVGTELNLKFLMNDDRYAFNTGFKNGIEVYTLRWYQSSFVSEERQEDIKKLFPIKIGNLQFNFETVYDYDYDDERDYPPAIGFSITELSTEPTRDDQIFIYWEQ